MLEHLAHLEERQAGNLADLTAEPSERIREDVSRAVRLERLARFPGADRRDTLAVSAHDFVLYRSQSTKCLGDKQVGGKQ